jgi:hypothetical protein
MTHYNPWPLGNLPIEWQRTEPALIKDRGYHWDDPREIISIFEDKLAFFSGSRFAVLTDCCSHAIFLSLKFRKATGKISIPKNTYISVPMQIKHSGGTPEFREEKWSGVYSLDPVGIVDGAGRFCSDMYLGGDVLQTLSFQIKKRLPIGKGGAILTDSKEAYEWLKLATYDGRDLSSPYTSHGHIQSLGWHYYMTPEDAARGILLMDQLGDDLPDTMGWDNYPNLLDYDFNLT